MRIQRKNTPQSSSGASSYTSGASSSSLGNMFSNLMMTSTIPPALQINQKKLTTSGALNALSLSKDNEFIVVAGREVLQVISTQLIPVANLRHGTKINLNTSSNDVSWSHTSTQIIATAATNGAIVIWDIQRQAVQKQERIISEHSRAVNRIQLHPTQDCQLLSASQDGTMKLWDLRTQSEAQITLEGKSESARDVAWNPQNPYVFACAFENGSIQKWDVRNPKLYERKLNAHNGLCLTVDWHADGRYLASGGRDKLLKIWDMDTETRKPLHTVQCIASVVRANWRPGGKYHIATCSLLTDNRVCIWDLERSHVPLHCFEEHTNGVSGIAWSSADTLYSVGKDSQLIVNKFGEELDYTGFRPLDTMASNLATWLHEDSVMVAQKKVQQSHELQNNMTWSGMQNQYTQETVRSTINDEHEHLSMTNRLNVTQYFSRRQQPKKPQTLNSQQIMSQISQAKDGMQLNIFKPENFQSLKLVERDSVIVQEQFVMLAQGFALKDCQKTSEVCAQAECSELAHMWNVVSCCSDYVTLQWWVDLIFWYADVSDYQTACHLIMHLNSNGIDVNISKNTQLQWMYLYQEQLQMAQLFTESAQVLKFGVHHIQKGDSIQNSLFYVGCSLCGKAIMSSDTYCKNCEVPNYCSICRLPVLQDQLYTYCRGCTHGGHQSCMQKWFSQSVQCPTGCLHSCTE